MIYGNWRIETTSGHVWYVPDIDEVSDVAAASLLREIARVELHEDVRVSYQAAIGVSRMQSQFLSVRRLFEEVSDGGVDTSSPRTYRIHLEDVSG